MVLTIVIVAFGVVGLASGVTYWIWMGWLPAEQRTTPFKGGAHADLVLMGVSIVLLDRVGWQPRPGPGGPVVHRGWIRRLAIQPSVAAAPVVRAAVLRRAGSPAVTPGFGEEGRRLSYASYLKVPELLMLQQRLSDEHDELLFIVAHQVYELWFKVVLFELEAARDRIDADDIFFARHRLHRVRAVERLLVEQIEVLETISPQDFVAFRSRLSPASGFQSVQFREIEFLSGLKEPRYLARLEGSPDEMSRLRKRLEEPTVDDAFHGLIKRRGSPSLLEIFRDRERYGDLFDLCEALLDHDEAFALWRARHVLMVERQIGSKTGTGGSTGAQYLRSTLDKRFYPELWAVRSEL